MKRLKKAIKKFGGLFEMKNELRDDLKNAEKCLKKKKDKNCQEKIQKAKKMLFIHKT